MKKVIRYTIGDDGEVMRVMPNGQTSFSDSLTEAMRDMYEFDKQGFEVLIDDEPLIPKHGFLGWLHRMIDKLPHRRRM